ncbi:MAG: ABC transporter substrate-binding protein [Pseudomonadota bacterium]|nr:ABC transporter substrate-binding protein [Pseudomonadota bacterium]MDO7710793.1 ABC transporter substrate-binding protein [Pseudomonadota bacterium]
MRANKHFINKAILALLMLITMIGLSSFAVADEMPVPQALVKASSDKMMQSLKDNKAQLEADPDFIYGLVTDVLMPHFDFEKMAKLALGKNWRGLSVAQQLRFTDEFRLLLIRTYSTAMLEYSDQEIRFLPFRDDVTTKRVQVDMDIIQAGGPAIPMSLSLYQNENDAWKVYDVKIDGISLVTNYRSTFATEIRNDGINNLIERLASKNEKVKT